MLRKFTRNSHEKSPRRASNDTYKFTNGAKLTEWQQEVNRLIPRAMQLRMLRGDGKAPNLKVKDIRASELAIATSPRTGMLEISVPHLQTVTGRNRRIGYLPEIDSAYDDQRWSKYSKMCEAYTFEDVSLAADAFCDPSKKHHGTTAAEAHQLALTLRK